MKILLSVVLFASTVLSLVGAHVLLVDYPANIDAKMQVAFTCLAFGAGCANLVHALSTKQ